MTDTSQPDPPVPLTETHQSTTDWERAIDPRVPGLTILYHPELDRAGERCLLQGTTCELARHIPSFAAPQGGPQRPLADTALSRRPITLRVASANGSMTLLRGTSRTSLEADGRAVDHELRLTAGDIERGVVLLLAGRVVLLLHLLDPLSATAPAVPEMIGESPEMARVRHEIARVADLDVPVLLRGETGTGKELVARAIHDASPRRARPFIAVNMAAIPPSLAAAELFGAARGAYTGSRHERGGTFARADGGTLFLDEIGETPPEVQALLLRALETSQIQAVGAETQRRVDVRVISATDKDLEAAIHSEQFRSPLLYRLAGFTLRLPPLRQRREDFGRLLAAFLKREMATVGEAARLAPGQPPWLPPQLVARLAAHDWPGNVRQLANVVRQLAIAHRGAERVPMPASLDELLGPRVEPGPAPQASALHSPTSEAPISEPPVATGPRKPAEIDQDELLSALRAHRWRLKATADALGIASSSLYHLIARSDRVRIASDLTRSDIEAARAESGGSLARMADALEVSERALRRRMGQLGIS
ncbi:MAG: sigma-54 dependent transcriptional regulator [Acidobacteriota bacterium]